MYILFYANGVVTIISGYLNLILYPLLGLKYLVLIVGSFGVVAQLFLILIH